MFARTNKNHKQIGDRFIPRRLEINVELLDRSQPWTEIPADKKDQNTFINLAKVSYTRCNYEKVLKQLFFPLETRILNFSTPKTSVSEKPTMAWNDTWPVKPRKKPEIGSPEIILDMPNFDSNICHHIADWSSKNCLATIFEKEVHMWHPKSNHQREISQTDQRAQHFVKWLPNGTRFALGLRPGGFGIWDTIEKKLLKQTLSCHPFCEIHCAEIISHGYIITGCSHGYLSLFTSDTFVRVITQVNSTYNSIISIVSSCKKNYVAVNSMDKAVRIWQVPHMVPHYFIKFKSIVRALAWHPWKNGILAMGFGVNHGGIMIWNVNTLKRIAFLEELYKNGSVSSMSFNPISGELVVGYYVSCERNPSNGCGLVTVLSNINKIVEDLHLHQGHVLYLLWGKGGRNLASVSADENLCIWNFFGDASKIKKKSKNSTIFKTYIR